MMFLVWKKVQGKYHTITKPRKYSNPYDLTFGKTIRMVLWGTHLLEYPISTSLFRLGDRADSLLSRAEFSATLALILTVINENKNK